MRSDWLLYLAIFLTCYSNTLRGQNPFFRHYDTDDGLPSNEIYLIERDDQGLIWMVTDRGVCVYDGYDFRVYTTEDGLSYNTNFRIFKDRHDRMWFTAWDGSISCYENGRFRAYHLPQDSLYASFPGYANQLWFGQDDMIYIAKSEESRSTNLFRFNPHTNQTQLVSLSELGEYLQEDKANGIVLTEIGGRPCIQGRMNLYATSIVFDGLHHRWYATFERNYSLYIDSRSSTSVRITEEKIHNIYLDSNHDLWFCTAQGLLRYENADINEPETLFFEGVDVTSILMDREGSYWVATRGKGLFWVPSFALRSLLQPEERMEERRVLSAAPLSEHLILGTISDGLFVLDRQFEVLPTGKEWRAINEVKRMYPTEGHDIHLSLVRVDERAGGLNLITEKTIVPHTSSSLVLQLRNGLFISSRRFGYSVSKAWGEEAIFSVAQEFKDHGSTFNGRIKCMGENRDHLWLGTLNGLYHLPTADLLFRPPDKDSSQLLSVRIEDLSFVDQQGMWVATIGNGLVYKKGPHLQAFSTEVGMSSNLIHRIYPENDSVLWVGTNQGLDKVTYRTTESGVTLRSIANFSTADGLASNFINDLNIWQDQLVLATDHGINFFPPSALQESTTPPLIHWEDVRAGPHSVLDSQNLQLAHDENDLEFKYLGVCFKKPQNQRFYRYRLRRDGQEPEWYYTDNRSVRFQDLAAGQYRFEVAAQNKTGYWSKQTLGFDFYIQPH
ncbi:MAG: two-component regulator propeller domain-containing protein [Bacteroidota bacterium]